MKTLHVFRSFAMRMLSHQNRLPKEPVDDPSLEMFKARLEGALNNPGGGCPCSHYRCLRSLATQTVLFPYIGTSYRKCWTPASYISTRGLKLAIEVFNEFIIFSGLSYHVHFFRW